MERIICIVIGYFIGCIQSAYIIGRIMGNIDIRKYGSGNAGTTNVTRVLGKKAGAIVFVCDILKGVAGYVVCSLLFGGSGTFFESICLLGNGFSVSQTILPGIYGGVGVILGHDFPFFLQFRGGKGIASTLGFILCIDPVIAVITYVFGLLVVIATKYISACSLTMTLLCPLLMLLTGYIPESCIIMFVTTVLAWYQHRGNIQRIIKGEENKFSLKSKSTLDKETKK